MQDLCKYANLLWLAYVLNQFHSIIRNLDDL